MVVVCKQIFVSGRVQGVFYRDSTRQQAEVLKLRGGVRNLRDGRVEVKVAGDEESVTSLIKWLKTGPKLAKVSNIEVIDMPSESMHRFDERRFEVWMTR
jgi:acylphosphatase